MNKCCITFAGLVSLIGQAVANESDALTAQVRPVGSVVATLESRAIIEYPDGTQRLSTLRAALDQCRMSALFVDSIGLTCGRSDRLLLLSGAGVDELGKSLPEVRKQVHVSSESVRALFSNSQRLLSALSLRPAVADGLVYGYRVDSLRSSIEAAQDLGLQRGDVIVELDGAPAGQPGAFRQMLDALGEPHAFSIVIERNSARVRLEYLLE